MQGGKGTLAKGDEWVLPHIAQRKRTVGALPLTVKGEEECGQGGGVKSTRRFIIF